MPPIFPPARTLIVKPSDWYSLNKTPVIVSGGVFDSSRYPPSALTDGSARKAAFRFQSTNGSVVIDLGSFHTVTPNILAIFGHNFPRGTILNVQGSVDGIAAPSLNRGFSVRQPACWIDLRGFSLTGDSWTLSFQGVPRPPIIGEIAIAYGTEFEGVIEGGSHQENIEAFQERGYLEYGKLVVSASGGIKRKIPLRLTLRANDLTNLLAIDAEAGLTGSRVIVVPDTRLNDIYLADWQPITATEYPQSLLVTRRQLDIQEEAFGAY